MQRFTLLLVVLFCSISTFAQTEGTLEAFGKNGKSLGASPLRHTSVKADISGFLARVKVVQEFENKFNQPIEAVYTFPLPENSAVDDMTMLVGTRTIRGKIMRREEARKVYETAKTEGKTASLLDQERPNIFTQAVANILPNEKITVEISYVETLKYEDGEYEFVFPMTVAPRYIPASVKDAAKISPPVAATRAGHDVSIEINLDAGVPVEAIRSNSHEIIQLNSSPNTAKISLKNENEIPNKDFILRYDVTGKRIEDAVLTHRDERGGFFTLILQPPDKFAAEDVTPKEIVFVLDTSGSMSGFPIEKAKEAMKLSLDNLYPNDTFNLITFAGETAILFDKPVPATQANLEKAQAFLSSRQGAGGTEMMTAIKAALAPSDAQDHIRVVCFMTDGEVGNDAEIISEVQKHKNARVFSFGIGNSVNRYLLGKIAEEGRGEAEYIALTDDGSKAAKRFYERVRTPLLTDISIDWNGLPVADVYPNRIGDLFSAKPVILHGRYTKGASGTIRLKGKVAGQDLVREIPVSFPETESRNDV
ncbi:MAG TPA: VIT and VWA domain-containing protein, partial [Pyrinomonadaceae bacterium]|nr:VIT and VWA domain-containing protein [Pyrinomonadaceae bacterium]